MNSYWSSLPPAHLLPREPLELLRSRDGLRPYCYNREPFATVMAQECKAWVVVGFENPAVDSVPAREGWRCHSCKLLPDDRQDRSRISTRRAARKAPQAHAGLGRFLHVWRSVFSY